MQVNHSRAACAGLVAAFATDLPAGHAQSVRDAYLQDSRGEVVRASGLCMRNGYWTPAQSIAACDPEIAPRPAARATGCGRIDGLTVTGHADRLGSAARNQTLSELRAQAVAAYLVAKGMPQARASGAGTTLPVKACGEVRKQAELVACLAPNRRVVIEVRGTTP